MLHTEGEKASFYSVRDGRDQEVYIPKGHIWIEGDNKDHSRDSRDFGPISLVLIEGIVRYKIWPWDKRMKV